MNAVNLTGKRVTITYVIVDEPAWKQTNPLEYKHHGLEAQTAGLGDAFARCDEAESLITELLDGAHSIPSHLARKFELFLTQ